MHSKRYLDNQFCSKSNRCYSNTWNLVLVLTASQSIGGLWVIGRTQVIMLASCLQTCQLRITCFYQQWRWEFGGRIFGKSLEIINNFTGDAPLNEWNFLYVDWNGILRKQFTKSSQNLRPLCNVHIKKITFQFNQEVSLNHCILSWQKFYFSCFSVWFEKMYKLIYTIYRTETKKCDRSRKLVKKYWNLFWHSAN